MTLMTLQGAIELGIIYAIMALGVFISFRTLNMPDLTVDGSFVLGGAVSAMLCIGGHPILGLIIAFIAGCLAGCITAMLHTKLKIQPLLSGILTMLALYSVNLKVMGNKANIHLMNTSKIFSFFEGSSIDNYSKLYISFFILLVVLVLLFLLLKTKLGFVLRATGDNHHMVKALGVNTDSLIMIGLALSNGLVALSGAIIVQYQSFADISIGTGMVIIGLASVIIGEVIFGTRSLLRRLIAVVFGAISYRFVIAFAFELGMPPTDFKLISAAIVASALSTPIIKEHLGKIKRRIAVNKSSPSDNEKGGLV